MKATIKYNLNDRDDEMALKRALKSTDMALVLFEIQYNLKKHCEYFEQSNPGADMVEHIFDEINDLINEHDINVDELTE